MNMKIPKVLVSGFQSFLNVKINPTEVLMGQIQVLEFVDIKIKTVVLPVEFQNAFEVLKVQIESFKPDMVLSFGVANQREQLEIEKIAINFRSSKNEDTLGYQPKDEPIIERGPDGVFSNLNVSELVSDLTQQQIKIGVSYSAGTYVCNSLMYELCLDSKKNNYLAGFIHTPSNWQEDKLLNSVLKLIDSANRIHFKNF